MVQIALIISPILFFFVIYNPLDKSLFAAVDQFSNNPLYYSYEEGNSLSVLMNFPLLGNYHRKLTINEKHF